MHVHGTEAETKLGNLRFKTFEIISHGKCDDFAIQVCTVITGGRGRLLRVAPCQRS